MLWAAVAAVAALLAFLSMRPGPPGPLVSMAGEPVPDFDLKGLDTLHPGLAATDLRQGTVTVVNLFASWCLPCRLEAPQLKALADAGVVVHGIAVADKPADAAAFLHSNGDPFRRIGLDPERRAAHALRSGGLPETYVVAGDGTVRLQHPGEVRPEEVDGLLKVVADARR